MDEARRVLERLERIEFLRGRGADADALLGELRALLAEGEAWIAVEGAGTAGAARALADLDAALDAGQRPGEEVTAGITAL